MVRLQTFHLLLPEIKELLKTNDFKAITSCVRDIDPIDIAESWKSLSPQEQAIFFRLLPRRSQSQLFEELELEEQKILVEGLQDKGVEDLLSSLDPSAAARFVKQLPPRMLARFTELMKKEGITSSQQNLTFPPESVGSLMRSRFMTVEEGWTTHHALEHIRANTRLRHAADIYLDIVFVTDKTGRFTGEVSIRELIAAPTEMQVASLMDPRSHVLTPEMDREEAANLFRKYKLESAPVLGPNEKPIGILLIRDVLKIIQEETEEDFAKMAGMKEAGLLSKSALYITKVRFPWLIATCIGYFVVGWVVKSHELTLEKVIGLASFMPLIAAMGGNVGAQTATSVVRGIATGEIKSLGIKELILKEAFVGILLGALYGLGAGFAAHLIYGARFGWQFAFVVGTGMFAGMTAASIMGALEPFIFEKMKIDPATATGPLITFFADLTSTSVYLTVATWLFLKF